MHHRTRAVFTVGPLQNYALFPLVGPYPPGNHAVTVPELERHLISWYLLASLPSNLQQCLLFTACLL